MNDPATAGRPVGVAWTAGVLALLGVALLLCVRAVMPLRWGIVISAEVVWFALPGILIARALYGRQRGTWIAALLFGGVWGHTFSTMALLALWAAGYRSGWIILLAPVLTLPVALLVRPLSGNLQLPRFTRADVLAVTLLLLIVPAIVGRPFARVGVDLPDGRAYRAYFTADFIWRMAVAAEVSKGDVPPRNQFLAGEPLNYYWLPHLLPAVQHQAKTPWILKTQPARLDQILLVHSIVLDVVFVAFMYGFARHLVASPIAAAIGCASAVLFTSFEGLERLWYFREAGLPLGGLRVINIDAVENWYYGSLKVDGLQRLLWYQPHHAMGYAVGLSSLLCATQARQLGRLGLMVWLGALLAGSLLISTFAALMFAVMATVYAGVRLLRERQFRILVPAALAAAAPLAVGLAVAFQLRYVDKSESLIELGLNPLAAAHVWPAMPLSFGPLLFTGALGLWMAWRRRIPSTGVFAVIVGVSLLFYFFVDVKDHQHVYVGWRSGHFMFFAFAGLTGFVLQELWRRGRQTRVTTVIVACVLALAAAPTTAIDFYNTQDIDNRERGPGFRWTTILTPDEVAALDWIRLFTPKNALVQVDPKVRDQWTWAYIPAFAERRMAAGIPISMIPLDRYQAASRRVTELYQSADVQTAYDRATALHIDYLVIGPPERDAYPKLQAMLDERPSLFRPAFRNDAVVVYLVTK